MTRSSKAVVLTLGDIAARVNARLEGDPEIEITGAATIEDAGRGQITFLANPKYKCFLSTTQAAALVLDTETIAEGKNVLRHPQPYLAFARILDLLYPPEQIVPVGTDPSAVIEPGAQIDSQAAVGPLCHICREAHIGARTQLISSAYVGRGSRIGSGCLIYPGVKIMDNCRLGDNVIIHASTVIGSDGFGFAPGPEGLMKVPQVGWVEIDDEVEIGSNCSVDRGALGPTRIGKGTKIDNLVQIAHNVRIGNHSVVVAQVGISGSTKIGQGVQLGGQAGIVGHIELGDGVRVGAQSGVNSSLEAGATVLGSPARDIKDARRQLAAAAHLPELLKRLRRIEKKLDD
ncbi:MAG: UDP-3-O-(3-hydroxymyristoyl)glucosamine N-acyltransferase [bacterium]